MEVLNTKLKNVLNDIAFLELNKDIFLGSRFKIREDAPLPVKSEYLVNGIKSGEYLNSIPLQKFVDSMIFVIGCDENFKYNSCYMEIIKNTNPNIESYILHKALEFAGDDQYFNALIYFKTLERVSDKHEYVSYNIANTLRELAVDAKNNGNKSEYDLYYKLSYYEFYKLSQDCSQLPNVYYYLGFYSFEENNYDRALDEWNKAYELTQDKDMIVQILNLKDLATDNILFARGRDSVVSGDAIEGLKRLIPLLEKHEDWNEVRYYTALGYIKMGNYKKAEILLDELLKSGESFSQIFNELGLCLFNLGDIDKAIENLEKAVQVEPLNPGYLCNLGLAYYKSGNKKKAVEIINRAYSINSSDEVTVRCREWINRE